MGERALDPVSQAVGRLEGRFDQFEKRVDERFDAVDRRFEWTDRLVYFVLGAQLVMLGLLGGLYLRVADIAARMPAP